MQQKVLKEVIFDSYTLQESLVKTKKWGNSLGVILPADLVKAEHLKGGEEVVIKVERKHNVFKEMFGAVKFKGDPTKTIKKMRKEWDSKWL